MSDEHVVWPEGKSFAFTVFDDTDRSTVENVAPIYDFLRDIGFRTTKSVWPLAGEERRPDAGSTCNDRAYLDWVRQLQRNRFEIGYHMASFHSSRREKTIRALDTFAELFGTYPQSMANHVGCAENIYWGEHRLSGWQRRIYNLATRNRRRNRYSGHIEDSEYFWGDVCKARTKYVRNFVFPETNTLKMCPWMPYHDPERPYVNYWFASSAGSTVEAYNKCLSEKNQDRLEEEGGLCIMYAHFAFGFFDGDRINPQFERLMKKLSGKNGWFVPVSELLDFLLERNGHRSIEPGERACLERRWLRRKLVRGTA